MKDLPKIQSSKQIYSGFFDLRQDLLEKADGQMHTYTCLILSTHAVVILAQTECGRWILNREYRHPTGQILLGPPGGRLEENENPILGGQRELYEETGYWSNEWQILGCCYPFPGICDQKIYYVLAKNAVKKGPQQLDPFEFINVELKTDEQLQHELQNSSKIDGNLCTALWYKSQL